MKIYIAGPLFSQGERDFNARVKQTLNRLGFDSFLPQEDGILVVERLKNGESIDDIYRDVYQLDIQQMQQCDAILAILDGAVIDEGTAFEIGFMKALNKNCFGLQTDSRRQIPTGNNPMIDRSLCHCFLSLDELEQKGQMIRLQSPTRVAVESS